MDRLRLVNSHISPSSPSSSSFAISNKEGTVKPAARPSASTDPAKETPSPHYNDWPNDQGFNVMYEEREPIELEVTGTIPPYAAGTLYRTGRSVSEIQTEKGTTYKVGHWFDGFSQVHRFQIVAPHDQNTRLQVIYNSRRSSDGLIEEARRTGQLGGITFGKKYDPCMTYFQKVMSTFKPALKWNLNSQWDNVNLGVTISANHPGLKAPEKNPSPTGASNIKTLCNKTDAPGYQLLDPQTLEPIGFSLQSSLHPDLKGTTSATHAKSDPLTCDVYNYNLDFGRNSTYRVFRASAATGKVDILATIPTATPAYIHSLLLSSNFVILCAWNAHYTYNGLKLLWNKTIIEGLHYNPAKPAKWYVVDRRTPKEGGKGLIAVYDSEPFFCFHTVNAYEISSPSGGTDIIADVVTYENLDILKRFYLENLLSTSDPAADFVGPKGDSSIPTLKRFRLASIPTSPDSTLDPARSASLEVTLPRSSTPELPCLNPNFITKPYRYIYGVFDHTKSTFLDTIVKLDLQTRTTKTWSMHGHSPGEPVFISPHGSGTRILRADEEDEGVLLSVVLDGKAGRSYLLCLDARNMEEMGRAEVPGVVGFGFHGTFVGPGGRHVEY